VCEEGCGGGIHMWFTLVAKVGNISQAKMVEGILHLPL
jgi:hypothetical protein